MPSRYNFTDDELEEVKSIQLTTALNFIPGSLQKVMFTQMMNPIIQMMRLKLGLSYNEQLVSEFDQSKLLIFSAHDTQLSVFLKFLKPKYFTRKSS